MTAPALTSPGSEIVYLSSDGKRTAENTQQGRWITTLYGNLCALFRDNPDVFIAADNLWYPVEGDRGNLLCTGRLRRFRSSQGGPRIVSAMERRGHSAARRLRDPLALELGYRDDR